jgi:hypothetical protein
MSSANTIANTTIASYSSPPLLASAPASPVPCPHWRPCSIAAAGDCALRKFGGRPSRGTCLLVCLPGLPVPPPAIPSVDTSVLPLALRSLIGSVPPVPSWAELHAQITALAPDLLPELQKERAADAWIAGAGLPADSPCQDQARRQTWADRLAHLPPAPSSVVPSVPSVPSVPDPAPASASEASPSASVPGSLIPSVSSVASVISSVSPSGDAAP